MHRQSSLCQEKAYYTDTSGLTRSPLKVGMFNQVASFEENYTMHPKKNVEQLHKARKL